LFDLGDGIAEATLMEDFFLMALMLAYDEAFAGHL